jgi:hypothetical protein
MNSFSEYMNRVKAGKELKDKTDALVRTVLSNTEYQQELPDSGLEFRKKRVSVKKFLLAGAALTACLVLILGGNAYYHMPVKYICLDINPSIELGINAFGRIVSTQAYNEDGIQLLGDNEYSNLSWTDVVSAIVQDAAEQGYITEDNSTVIAVTAELNNEKTAADLQNTCAAEVNLALRAAEASAIVYTDCVNLQFRTQACEAGVSPGKFKLIKILQILDPSVTLEQFKNAKISDIITSANKIISESACEQNKEYAVVLEKIQNAAQRVEAAYGSTQQEQSQNQGLETGAQQQRQNQCSDSAAQEQEQKQNGEITGTEQAQKQEQNQNIDANTQLTQGQSSSDQAPVQTQNKPSDTAELQTGNQSGTGNAVPDNSNNSQNPSVSEETESTSSGYGSSSGHQSGNGKGNG